MQTKLMGILNVTPDSCFDQGRWFQPDIAFKRAFEMVDQGADILDIGGESTRPGAIPVPEEEELKRVIPLIKKLQPELSIPISVDTMKHRVAAEAIEAGATLINDVSGFHDPLMRKLAAESNVKICVMHMHQNPQTMQHNPHYQEGIIPFLITWFQTRITLLLESGIKKENIIIDPGIGFGKTVAHNVEIVQNLHKIKQLGYPVLLGHSRKSFMGKILHKTYPDLLPPTLAITTMAVQAGIDIIRVHDISENRDVLNLLQNFNELK